jgi:hypothetical protein
MSMDHFEESVNAVSDKDWSWWPFLWLRPEKQERLTLVRVASIAMLYGAPASALMALGIKLQYAATRPELVAMGLFFPVMFLCLGSVVVAPMWNRRSDRLRARLAAGLRA